MKPTNKGIVIFRAYKPRKYEWDTATGIQAERRTDGSVYIRITSETETEDVEYKSKTISASEAEALGRALLCIPEDDDTFDALIDRASKEE